MNYKSFLIMVVLCTTINCTTAHGLSMPPPGIKVLIDFIG